MSENVPLEIECDRKPSTRFQAKLLDRRRQIANFMYWRISQREMARRLGVSRRTVIRDKRWLENNVPNFRKQLQQAIMKRVMAREGIGPELIRILLEEP